MSGNLILDGTTACPKCAAMLKISTAWFRQRVACPHCDCSFSISSLLSDPAEDSENLSVASLQQGDTVAAHGEPEPPPHSKQLGRYRLVRLLGAGGFGVVYLAEDPELGRQVAIKMPRLSIGSEGSKSQSQKNAQRARARFRKEARSAAKLRHPNIVAVFDHGENADGVFIVYEYVAGETLEHAIQHGELQREVSLRHIIAVANALAYAARENIVHRDIKPANIMLDERGSPQIMDFGLAEALDGGTANTGGSIAGTPAYMSPEQARGEREIGPASDQYALAAILYELVCGTRAITVRGRAAIAEIADRQTPPLEPLAALDEDLRCIILKAMHREPEQRYPNAGEFAQDLQDYLLGLPVAANPRGPVGRLLKWSRRNRPTAAALTASLVLLLGIALVSSVSAIKLQQGQQALSSALDDAQTARDEAQRQAANANQQRKLANQRALDAEESQRIAEQEKHRAEQQQKRAEEQEQLAKQALAKEREAQHKREQAEQMAEQAIESEEQKTAQLNAATAANRTLQYEEWLTRAAADIRRHDYESARQSLEKCDPQQRGWEWSFLLQACTSDGDYFPLSETPQDLRQQLAFPTYLSQFPGYEIYEYGEQRAPYDAAESRAAMHFTADRRFGFAVRDDALYRFDFAADTRLALLQASELHSVEPLDNQGTFAVNVTRTEKRPGHPRGVEVRYAEVWGSEDRQLPKLQLPAGTDWHASFALFPQREAVVGTIGESQLGVWSMVDGQQLLQIPLPFQVSQGPGALAQLPDQRLAILDTENRFHYITPETGKSTKGAAWETDVPLPGKCWDASGRYLACFRSGELKRDADQLSFEEMEQDVTATWLLIDATTSTAIAELPMPYSETVRATEHRALEITEQPKAGNNLKTDEDAEAEKADTAVRTRTIPVPIFRKRLLGIDALVVSESGGRVAVRDSHGGIRTWKLSGSEASQGTSEQLLELRDPLVAAADSGTVTVWTDGTKLALHDEGSSHPTHQQLRRTTGTQLQIVCVADEGNRVATIDNQSLITFFTAGRQTAATRLSGATTANFVSAGRTLVVGTEQGEVVTLDAESGNILNREKAHTGSVTMIVDMPNQQRYVTAGTDRALRFWDTQTGQEIEGPLVVLPQAATCGDYHPQRQLLAICCNTTLAVYRCADTAQEVASAAIPHSPHHVVFLQNGQRILMARDRELKIVNAEDARVLYSFPNVSAPIRCIKRNRDNPTLLLGDGTLRSWKVR